MANIPYQLVSMAAILRDYTDPKYISDEHYKLTSIADYFYNACFGDYDNDAKNLLPEYKAVYDEYGAEFFEKVLDDMYALDSQVTGARKEQELLDDYNDRLNSVSASSKICSSRSIKADSWRSSSWSELNKGGYSHEIKPSYTPVMINGWELGIEDTIDEMVDDFWFDDDDEGGTGGTRFFGIGTFTKPGTDIIIKFAFWIVFFVLGNPDDPDLFDIYEPDRSLDRESGVELEVRDVIGIDEDDAKEILEENQDDIFDVLVDVVSKHLDKFGY